MPLEYGPPLNLAAQSISSTRASVLVVDDQAANIQLLYALLESDYDVQMAIGGADALHLIDENPPDLILLDIQMPGISGYDVCSQLKASDLTRHIPIIFVTAQTTSEEETRCLKMGAVDFVAKPFNPEVVKARVRTHAQLKQQSDLLRAMAYIDGLTGLANRRHFGIALEAEWRRCRRNQSPLAALLIDLDHFKQYNDHYGHQAGDACLMAVAQQMAKHSARSHDLLARYGGEEIVFLMPECDLPGAMAKAESMRQSVETMKIEHVKSSTAPTVTVSIGAHSLIPSGEQQPSVLVEIADQQLYRAKAQGRNRVSG